MKPWTVTLLALTVAAVGWAAPASSPRLLIPAAASVPGLAGSHWRTDLVIHNPSAVPAEVVIELIPSGFEGGLDDPCWVVLPDLLQPDQTVVVGDVLGTHFPEQATGALVVVGRHPTEPVQLVAGSRTWTPSPDGIGTLGQGIGGIPWRGGDLLDEEKVLVGLESSEAFRTNLGLVNPTWTFIETFQVEILDAAGATAGTVYYTLQPRAHFQRNDILRTLGLDGSGYTAVVSLASWQEIAPAAADGPPAQPLLDFAAYASRVDNRSNDPSYIAAQAAVERWGPPRHRVLPAVARTPGAGDTVWSSDVSIHYPGPNPTAVVFVRLIPTGGQGIGEAPPEREILSIRQGETLTVADVLGELFPEHEVAALVVESLAGTAGVSDIWVDSRTWTPTGSGLGTMGQGIPGFSRAETSSPVVIPGLESSDSFRTNLGLVNVSLNLRSTFAVDVFDASGALAGSLSTTLEPWSHVQIDELLGELSLTGSGYTARVSLAATENLYTHPSESWEPIFLAYGSRVDRASGDPTFVEAVPLVEPPADEGDWFDFRWDEPWYRCPDEEIPDDATVVQAFNRAWHWFGSEDHREIVQEVQFPEAADWNQIGLRLRLECPDSGLCDHWDRTGSLQLVLNPDDPPEQWQYLEIMRHITPYRVGMCQYVDVTPLAPLLAGRQTLVSWIDTWVGPGHSNGDGWAISFDFVFYPGEERGADEVVNIWGRRNITLGYTDPEHNVDAQIEPVEVAIPADATRVEARLTTTGHSFGNTDNCAEFCVLRQDLYVDGERRSVVPWRTDCEHNPVRGQQGTWTYDRNGWCPGAIVVGDTIDITDIVTPGSTAAIDFDIRTFEGEEYENASPGDYDPLEWISLQLYIWRE